MTMKSTGITETLIGAALLAMGALTSCGGHGADAPAPDSVHVADVYTTMFRYGRADSAERAAMLRVDSAETMAFMKVVGELPTTDERIQGWSWSLPVLMFTPAVDSVYTDTDSLALAIGNTLARMRAEGIELPPRKYAAVVWGRYESVMFVDSVMLVALNHYLGAEYEAYSHFPLYMRLVKEPKLMPYDIAEALIATEKPYDGGDSPTALSRMLYEGALTVAKIKAVDGGTPREALGYRPEQFTFLEDEESNLWNAIVARGLLYDTSDENVRKLVGPGPNTALLDVRAPGRAGRYIGYRIVESYLRNNPDATLPYLLSPEFYRSPQTLALARYNP